MNLLDIILLAVALAMDCFTVSIVSGVICSKESGERSLEKVGCLRMAFLFGFFSHFQSYMEAYDHWIAFALLAFIGGKMIWESFGPEEEQHFNPRRLRTQLLLAIATSIDALAVGISLACTGYERLSQLTLPLVIIGVVSFLFSIVGYQLGARFGHSIARRLKPELFGGVILLGIGIKILVTHIFS